jgi:hypothetical protein
MVRTLARDLVSIELKIVATPPAKNRKSTEHHEGIAAG